MKCGEILKKSTREWKIQWVCGEYFTNGWKILLICCQQRKTFQLCGVRNEE